MNSRVAAALLLLIALAGVAIFIFLQGPPGGSGTPDQTQQTQTRPAGTDPSSLAKSGQKPPESKRRVANPSGGSPVTATVGSSDPVVVFGVLTLPNGVKFDGIEVELQDPAGETIAAGEPNEKGAYEIRYDRAVLGGWSVSTTWLGVTALDGRSPAETTYAPSFRRFPQPHKPSDAAIECNLTVYVPPIIEGRVVSRDTGAAIEGATVSLVPGMGPWKDFPTEDADTDVDGKYQLKFTDLSPSDFFVYCKVDSDEYQAKVVGPLELKSGEKTTIDFVLEPPAKVRGTVVSAETGAPIKNATVTVISIDYTFVFGLVFGPASVETGDDGRFEIEATGIPLDRAMLKVEAAGHAPDARRFETADVGEIRLGGEVVVSGIVKDEEGKPVMNTGVYFSMEHEWTWNDLANSDYVKTDGTGRFKAPLRSVPPARAFVYVDQEPFAPFLAPLHDLQQKSSTPLAREIEITLKMSRSLK